MLPEAAVTNAHFRKVSRDNIRPDFQLGRKSYVAKVYLVYSQC